MKELAMSKIRTLLDQIAMKEAEIARMEEELRDEMPEFFHRYDQAQNELKRLQNDAKNRAKYIPNAKKQTIAGRTLQMIWKTGRYSAAELEKLARGLGATVQDLEKCRGKGFWQFGKVGKKG
jgi:hypothetical protein